jgi:hypothetical protein
MLLFNTGPTTPVDGGTSSYQGAQGVIGQANELKDAITNFVAGTTTAKTVIENANKALVSMNDSTLTLQRSMGGVVVGANSFREKLIQSYQSSLNLGASFQDITDAVGGLAEGMGRVVNPSKEFLENTVATSKATGIATKELGILTAELYRYTLNQDTALEKIHNISVEARKSGLDAKSLVKDVEKNLKNISGFGFKNGIEGLTKMAKQAAVLRTSMEAIGAKKLGEDVLDPERAIEVAASFQMLGGAVGKLGDPFQLLYMAQTNVEGLQDELIKSAKSAAVFNKETGKFDVSTQDMYRLREQAKLTGANLEDLVNTGREASKLQYLKDTFSLDGLTEDQQNLVTGLANFKPGGKVSIDLPGFEEGNRDLAELMKDNDFKLALDEYQAKAAQSEKDLAISQMTISENQAKDINIIKETLLSTMTETQRTDLLKQIEDTNEKMAETAKVAATTAAPASITAITKVDDALNSVANQFEITGTALIAFNNAVNGLTSTILNKTDSGTQVNDLFIGASSSAPKILSKGKLFEGIVGDEVAVGTNLGKALSSVGSNIGGNIDININLNGSIAGDPGQLNKMFNSPEVQKQIMDTVLYKLNDYKRQQGVLS